MLTKKDLRGYFKSQDGTDSWESKPILNSFFKNNADEIKEWESSGVLSKALNKKNPEITDALIRVVLLSVRNGSMGVSEAASIFDTFKSLMVSSYRFQYQHRSYTLANIFDGNSGVADWLETIQMVTSHPLFFKKKSIDRFYYKIDFGIEELFQVTIRKAKIEKDPQKREEYFQFLNGDVFSGLMPKDAVMSAFVGLADDNDHEFFHQTYLYLLERFKNPTVKIRYPLPLSYFPRSSFASYFCDDMNPEVKEKLKHVFLVVIQNDVFFDRHPENWSSCNWLFDSNNVFSVNSEWNLWQEVLGQIKIQSSSGVLSHSYSLGYTLMNSAFGKLKDIRDPEVAKRLEEKKQKDIKGLKNFLEFYQGKSAEEVLSLILELQNGWKNAFNYALPLQTDHMFEDKVKDHFWKPLLGLISPFVEDEHETAQKIVEQSWVLLQQIIPEALRGTHNSEVEFDCEKLGHFMQEAGWDVVSWAKSKKVNVVSLGGLFLLQPLLEELGVPGKTSGLEKISYPFRSWLNNIGNAQKFDDERYMKKKWDSFLVPICELMMKDQETHEVMEVVSRLMEKRALLSVEKLLQAHRLTLTEPQQYKMMHTWLGSNDYKEGEPLRLYGLFENVLSDKFEQMMDVLSTDFSVPQNSPKRFNKLLSDVLLWRLDREEAEIGHLDFVERQYERKKENFNCEQRKEMIECLGLHHWHEKFKKIYESDVLEYLGARVKKKNILPSPPSRIERF